MMGHARKIQTLFGPIACEDDFIWDAHVHLWSRPFDSAADPDLILQDEELAVQELQEFYRAGGRVVVEFSPLDFHRNWEALIRISRKTKVAVIVGTGFYRSPGLDVFFKRNSNMNFTDFIREEVLYGEKETGIRPSFLKWSTSLNQATDAELLALDYISAVHKETGLPIATHTQKGTFALEQIELLKRKGVDMSRVLIAHLDMNNPLPEQLFLAVLKEGVHISFDQLGKAKYGTDESKINLLKKLCDSGYSDKIHLATDIGRRSNLKSLGGEPGYEHIPKKLIPMLEQAGFEKSLIQKLTNFNPANFFGIR